MQLHYLDFDFSDEESGRGSFDAMASVPAERLPALLAEVAAVTDWCASTFGAPARGDAQDDAADWDFDIQAATDAGSPLHAARDERGGAIVLSPDSGRSRVVLTLTLSGSAAFCAAFRQGFEMGD
jgi:hypothetical protein